MDMMSGMALMILLGIALFATVIGVAVYLGVRGAHASSHKLPSATDALQHRLAAGEITPEEYFERESALRAGAPHGHGR